MAFENRDRTLHSESGLSLVEVAMAIALFALIVLSVSMTLGRGIQHQRESFQVYRAMSAIRDLLAEIQEHANLPQDLSTQQGIGTIYDKYHDQAFPAGTIAGATIHVVCFANETTVPMLLGGPQDLNFDGDPDDDLANQSAGTDLKLVPMTLTATFDVGEHQQTLTVHRLIAKTTN